MSEIKLLFSIIIPTYNRAGLIIESLDSLKLQTYRPLEIIIVDDGSTDGTANVVEQWAQRNNEGNDLKIQYYFQANAGPGSARNLGAGKATGEFIQFLDSDDRLHPERLERLVGCFGETGADFIQTGFEGVDADTGAVISQHYGRAGENQVELALKGHLWANTLRSAFRASLVRKIGPWDTAMSCFEDREYVERAVMLAKGPIAMRDILASARRGGSERVSDRFKTYEGRQWRVHCEEQLAKGARKRTDINETAKREFASRVYALGFRCKARGWPDLAERCGHLAQSMGVKLDGLGLRRKAIFKAGSVAARAYALAGKLKIKSS